MKTKLLPQQRLYFETAYYDLHDKVSQPTAPIREIELYWNTVFTSGNGILGSFWWPLAQEICLSPVGLQTPELLVGVLFHELHHCYQFRSQGLLYVLQTIPGIRGFTIEPTAYAVEAEIDAILGLNPV